MGNGPDRLFMPKTRYRAAIDYLEDRSLSFNGSVGRLMIENPQQVTVALRGSVVVVDACTLIVAGAYSYS